MAVEATYYITDEIVLFPGGADFNVKMLDTISSFAVEQDVTVSGSGTNYNYSWTESGVPYNSNWPNTDSYVKAYIEVSTPSSYIYLKLRLSRVNENGVVQESTTWTSEQQLSSAGNYIFSLPTAYDWDPGGAYDRIRLDFSFRNSSATSKTVGIMFNLTDTKFTSNIPEDVGTTTSTSTTSTSSSTSSTSSTTSYTTTSTTSTTTYDWQHDYMGVSNSNISQVDGVSIEDIYTINEV